MAIPESQLDTWSKQGSITQSSQTYATIKTALEAQSTKYADKEFEVFLQGSYGNDTNIYAESDVDIVIRLDSTFFYNTDQLTLGEQSAFHTAFSTPGIYSYPSFKADVLDTLKNKFGNHVESGKKAFRVKANGGRRTADVIPAALFKRYVTFPSLPEATYYPGICFFDSSANRIENFPKPHSANCTAKHQATSQWFKPMIRILKNLRGRLVDNGAIDNTVAPSYFLEGLLYNVPNDKFGGSYEDSMVQSINWILGANRSKFVCASGLHWLFGTSSVSWSPSNCDRFLEELKKLWNNWP
jgi:hypothetical protein